MRAGIRARGSLVVLLAGTALLSACSSDSLVADTPAAADPSPSLASVSAPAETCDDGKPRTASYAPLPKTARTGLLGDIAERRLVVGVSSDSYLLGAFKPGSVTVFEGFDIDVAREVAKDLLGSPDRITFKVITAADRISAVNAGAVNGGVDLVARNFTMTCDRWKELSFSGVYFQAAQDTLIRGTATERSLKQLGTNRRVVCAPKGSTSLNALPRLAPGAVPYGADQHTACLALLQEGRVDAITGDNTVLAGLVAQDPGTKVLEESLSKEPYGLAAAKDHPELARYVNGVLERIRRDGTWQRLYAKHFGTRLSARTPSPPPLDLTKPLPS